MSAECVRCGGQHETGPCPPPAAGTARGEQVGATIAGRYHLVRALGDGGVGCVYKAADQVLRRFVAIKLLHRDVARNPSASERFEREARAAAAIGHPNIIDIIDFGRDDGRPYMVMEYVRGRSLSHVLATDGPLPIARACRIATHTLAGLAAAHEAGILHRDLKPANLLLLARLGDRSFVKVCDFGFAALLDESSVDRSLTPARTLVGTPAYAAPERLRGDDRRDRRLDVYSLGVVLFEMLAGRRPFEARTFAELARKVKSEPPPDLHELRPEVPPELARVVARALAKAREERWASAEEFAQALVPFGGQSVAFDDEPRTDSFALEMMSLKARESRRASVRPPPSPREPLEAPTRRLPRPEPRGRDVDATVRMPREHMHAPPPTPHEPAPAPERPTSVRRRPQVTTSDGASVDGLLVAAAWQFAERSFGSATRARLRDAMPPSLFSMVLEASPGQWTERVAYLALVEAIDAVLGRDDLTLVLECGRASAEASAPRVRVAPPEEMLVELPVHVATLLRGAGLIVRQLGSGYARLEIVEPDRASLTASVLVLGFVERHLVRAGAEDVEVTLTSARALDDDRTFLDVSWLV